jgi:hypothetical protein
MRSVAIAGYYPRNMDRSYEHDKALKRFHNCPSERNPAKGTAYRWVWGVDDSRNWLPRSVEIPGMKESCSTWGLSFFSSKEKAIEKLRHVRANYSNKYPSKIAEVKLQEVHGTTTVPNRDTHFDVHPFVGASFDESATIVLDIFE